MTAFRDGDWIRWPNGTEGRVLNVGREGALGDCILLRRPVRVGDQVKARHAKPPFDSWEHHVIEQEDIAELNTVYWEHLDGTPIDPPAAEPATFDTGLRLDGAGGPIEVRGYESRRAEYPTTPADRFGLVSKLLSPGTDPETGEEMAPLITAEQAKRLLDEPALEETADRVHGMVHRQALHERDAERQRANRLADEAGALRSERDDARRERDAAIVENARLVAELARLERKGGRR